MASVMDRIKPMTGLPANPFSTLIHCKSILNLPSCTQCVDYCILVGLQVPPKCMSPQMRNCRCEKHLWIFRN